MEQSIRISNQSRITAVLAAIVVILGIVAVLAFRTTTRMIQDRDWVAHSQRVLAELQETRMLVDDAEDEQRGYLITGDENFLSQFEEFLQRFVSKLDPLRRLMADSPAQQERIDRLATAAQTKFASMRAIIDTRRLLGPRQARVQVASEVRKNPVSEPSAILLEMVAAERGLLQSTDRPGPVQRPEGNDAAHAASAFLFGLLDCLLLDDCAESAQASQFGDRAAQEPRAIRAGGARIERRSLGLGPRNERGILLTALEVSTGVRGRRDPPISSRNSSRGCTPTTASESCKRVQRLPGRLHFLLIRSSSGCAARTVPTDGFWRAAWRCGMNRASPTGWPVRTPT